MASNTKPHQRAFALTIAIIFLITTIATGALVVMAIIDDNKKSQSVPDTSQLDQNTAANAADSSCTIGQVSEQQALPAPEVYKPEGDVTELQKTDLEAGSGQEVKSGDCVIAKYYGTLASSGEKFDENFTTTDALKFQVGTGNVIAGWDQGVVGMKVGGTRRLVIPSDMAYGENGSGAIPPNADLVFVVKVIGVQ